MTWPDGIALAVGLTTALLITHHQHRSTTATPANGRTEHRNGPHHQQHGEEDPGEEDHQPPTRP